MKKQERRAGENGIMNLLQQTLFEKPAMNFFSRIGRAGVLLLLATAPAAVAQNYNFTFTGNDGIDATGTITISGGVAHKRLNQCYKRSTRSTAIYTVDHRGRELASGERADQRPES